MIALVLNACTGVRTLSDPIVEIRTANGRELGVSTEYGVAFLGRTARSGPIELTAWFGDGPSIESSVIEPIEGGLCTAETEIRLPEAPLTFEDPIAGSKLLVMGRNENGPWKHEVEVIADPRVRGILTTIPPQFIGKAGASASAPDCADQVGAGVFVILEGTPEHKKKLVGLVSGIITLHGPAGDARYLTVVGPHDLWRLVSHRRDANRRRPWVYREDIL